MAIQILVDYLIRRKIRTHSEENSQALLRFVGQVIKLVLWVVGLLFILSNIGINVTSLVAGLGVGGIAVALAAQNILADLFSSIALYFDQPFRVGDFIVIDDIRGTVRHIGIKNTRIKSLNGEEIIIPNRELTADRIKNFRRMEERRVAFDVKITYDTPLEKLQEVPQIIEEVINSVPRTRFSRAHLFKFDDAAFIFRVVFFMTDHGFKTYMDARQEVNFKLLDAFKKAGIAAARPTQIVQVQQ